MLTFDGYRPGALASVVGLHARYYALHWGFGLAFETKVATELAEFLSRIDLEKDLFLAAYDGDELVGSIAVDATGGGEHGAHLRWFIVAKPGFGLGRRLLRSAIEFCDARRYARIWLTTFAGLDAARALYEKHGFVLTSEAETDQWHGGVREQRFERWVDARCPAS